MPHFRGARLSWLPDRPVVRTSPSRYPGLSRLLGKSPRTNARLSPRTGTHRQHTHTIALRTHTTSLLLLTGRSQWALLSPAWRAPHFFSAGTEGGNKRVLVYLMGRESGLPFSPQPNPARVYSSERQTTFLTWSWSWSRSYEPSNPCLLTPNTYTHLPLLLVSHSSYPKRCILQAFMRLCRLLYTPPLVSPTR